MLYAQMTTLMSDLEESGLRKQPMRLHAVFSTVSNLRLIVLLLCSSREEMRCSVFVK